MGKGEPRQGEGKGLTGQQREKSRVGAVRPDVENAIMQMGVGDECTYYRNRKCASEKNGDKF